jgi:hypothetical protein
MLLRQFAANEPALPDRHEAGWHQAADRYQGANDVPAGYWVWQRPYWFVFRDGPETLPSRRRWGPEQACGEPDCAGPGDKTTAWATEAEDAANEWLLLEYARTVRPTSLEVHENFEPGAVVAVAILTQHGEELELWRNDQVGPAVDKARVLKIDLPLGFETERIKLYLASDAVRGWNEIDAVGVRDDKGKLHWASRAAASSSYADVVDPLAVMAAPLPNPNPVVPLIDVMPIAVLPLPVVDAEKQALRERIAELEALVERLEAELAKAKAKTDG